MDAFADDPEAYSVVKNGDLKTGVYDFRLRLGKEPPLTQWALLIGDCIHNARSALDHLFWALVLRRHSGKEPPGAFKAGFPVYRDPARFLKKKAEIENFVGPDALAVLEWLQPFNTETPLLDAFAFLHKYDIIDKHRLLVPSVGMVEEGQVSIKVRERTTNPTYDARFIHQERLHDGAVLCTIVLHSTDNVVDVNFVAKRIALFFRHDDGSTVRAISGLKSVIGYVERVPLRFPNFFPSHGPSP